MHRKGTLFVICLAAIVAATLLVADNPSGHNLLATSASLVLVALVAITLNRLAAPVS